MNGAYRYCGWITTRHYENFPVASWLLPPRMRPHVAAVYAFARSADDFADEARYHGRALELLGQWRAALWASCNGSALVPPGIGFVRARSERMEGTSRQKEPLVPQSSLTRLPGGTDWIAVAGPVPGDHPIFLALADTVRRHDLPVQLLDDLLTAFTMDVTKRRYADWPDLMNYCRHSANPIGRLVLLLSGIRDEELHRRSDDICSALQLANHWQDLRIDLARDILYIPQDLMRAHGVTEAELRKMLPAVGDASSRDGQAGLDRPSGQGVPSGQRGTSEGGRERETSQGFRASGGLDRLGAAGPAASESFRNLMKELVERTRVLFDAGEPLVKHLKGGLRFEIKLTLAGGRAILDRIEAADYDVFHRRPVISTPDKVGLLTRALLS